MTLLSVPRFATLLLNLILHCFFLAGVFADAGGDDVHRARLPHPAIGVRDTLHVPHAHAVAANALSYRHAARAVSSTAFRLNSSANWTLTEPERIVLLAQEEAQDRNARLLENPRRNLYDFHYGVTDLVKDPETGTGNNETIAIAAATVSESLAGNSTAGLSRRAGPYWMENMVQNGKSPFATDPAYQVGYQLWPRLPMIFPPF